MPSNGTDEEQSYARYNERQRLLLFMSAAACLENGKSDIAKGEKLSTGERLDKDSIADMIEGIFVADKLKHAKTSPVTPATNFIMSSDRLIAYLGYPLDDKAKARKDIMEGCRYWFKAIALDPHRQSFADMPRATKSDEGLTEADFQWLGQQLLAQVWVDSQGNRRRYPGLEAMLQGCTPASEADDCHPSERAVADRLLEIKERATGGARENLDTLLVRVALKCRYVMHVMHACFTSSHPPVHRQPAEGMHVFHACALDRSMSIS